MKKILLIIKCRENKYPLLPSARPKKKNDLDNAETIPIGNNNDAVIVELDEDDGEDVDNESDQCCSCTEKCKTKKCYCKKKIIKYVPKNVIN